MISLNVLEVIRPLSTNPTNTITSRPTADSAESGLATAVADLAGEYSGNLLCLLRFNLLLRLCETC